MPVIRCKMCGGDVDPQTMECEYCGASMRQYVKQALSAVKPYAGEHAFIFISYAHSDKLLVFPIIQELKRRGFRVWYDEGIDPGTEWDDFIAERIESCGMMLALISGNYLQSDNCKDELNFARDLEKKRLLVYLEDVTLPRGMAMRLNRLQAIHQYTYRDMDSFMEKLLSTSGIEEFCGA